MAGRVVNVVSKSGQAGTMPEAAAEKAIASGAFRLETPEETAARSETEAVRAAQQSASNKGALAAVGLGAARGAFDAAVAPAKLANRGVEAVTGVNLGDKATQAIDRATGGTGHGQTFDEATSGGAVLSGLAGLATGALTDKTTEQGFREANEAQRTTALANRGSTMLGNIGGQVAEMALTGGAGLLAKGGQAAQAALAARGVGQVGARAGGMATAGVVEGALQGAAQASEDAYIENKPLTAERVWGTVGLNALLGGGAGAGLGAALGKFEARAAAKTALGATRRGEEEAIEGMARNVLGVDPAPGLAKGISEIASAPPGKLASLYEGAASAASGVDREVIGKYGPHKVLMGDAKALSAMDKIMRRDEIVDGAIPEITQAIDDFRRESNVIMDEMVDVGLKRENVAKNLAHLTAEERDMAVAAAKEQAMTTRQRLAQLADMETFGDQKWAKGAIKYADDSLNDVLSGTLGVEDSYMALDSAKRQLQRVKARAEKGIGPAALDMNKQGQLRDFTTLIDESQEAVRQHMMDESIWSKQGLAQFETNGGWERALKAKRLSDQALLTSYTDDFGKAVFEADPAKVANFVSTMGTVKASKVEPLVRQNLEATRDLIDTIAKNYDLGSKHSATLERARQAYERMSKAMATADETVAMANQGRAWLDAESKGLGSVLGGQGALLGGLSFGAPGALGGMAWNAATKPMTTAMQAYRLRALADNTVRRTTKALDAFFGHAPLSANIGKAAGAAARALPAAGRRAAVAAATGEPAMAEAPRHRERVAELAANPVALAAQVDKFVGGAASQLPTTHMALAAVPMRAIQFLASKLPPAPPQHALDGAHSAPIAPSDQARFDEYVHGATEPLSVLDALEEGTLTLARVEAMEAVYPEMYAELRTTVFDYVAAASQAERPLKYSKRQQLDVMFGGKGAIEPSMSPKFMRTVEQVAMLAKQAPPQHGGGARRSTAPSIAESMGAKTGLSRLER